MPVFASGDLQLYYEDRNPAAQKAIVLLHGLGTNCLSWALQIDPLCAAGFRLIAPDLRGFGQSSYVRGRQTMRHMTEDVANLLRELGMSPVHVAGISMGGTVALQLALDFPELVDRLIVVNTFARFRPSSLVGWLYFASRFALVHLMGLPAQARFVSRRIFPAPDQESLRRHLTEQILQSNPHGYRATMRALGRFDVYRRLADIRRPTLVVTGENDTTVSPATQRQLLNIPGARQVVIAGGGHAVIADQPEAFNRAMLEFLHAR